MTLPPVAPEVVPEVLDALPPRLRKRIDGALDRAGTWQVENTDTGARAVLDADTTLTWTLHSGVLTVADGLVCSCLLAPKCLHRAIAVAAAEVGETSVVVEEVPVVEGDPVREDERAAAGALWAACAEVLRVGATASGAVVRGEVLRAVHSARVVGLHRAAAGGVRVATGLAEAKAGASSFDRETLADDLVEVMLLCHDLQTGVGDPTSLRGTARREYRPVGSLRLHGLCTEAVLSDTGYAGAVTYLVAADRTLWTVNAVLPGGEDRVMAAANGPVAMGETGLTHRELGRAGLMLTGATASEDRRLGAGSGVRAVAATGAGWDASPIADLWDEPLADQLTRADGLLFLSGAVSGPTSTALRMSLNTGDINLLGATDAARDNLRLLGERPGMPMRVVARLVPDQPATAVAIAVLAPLNRPGHVDLTLDRLQRAHLPAGEPSPPLPTPRPEPTPSSLIASVVQRVVIGGRAVAALPSTARDAGTLARLGLAATAGLLGDLASTARDRERDAFGRVVPDRTDAFPVAWLTAAVHSREFARAEVRLSWPLPDGQEDEDTDEG
ncbi:hypothetical protein [Actinokineospora diospyrosa]|uniref:SWIM-type domain-containing protein n=1 Tax=Actinokineospora diospyrosa TaxID=103728 RepID=A0ABT1IFL7_9PSEU|nr:hypothetical protein [Actinokineospora diospyrosa]MCP2271341.1 hypothetical protein [Actinokineospora diospyrosa]